MSTEGPWARLSAVATALGFIVALVLAILQVRDHVRQEQRSSKEISVKTKTKPLDFSTPKDDGDHTKQRHLRAQADRAVRSQQQELSQITQKFRAAIITANGLRGCWKGKAAQYPAGVQLNTDIQQAIDRIESSSLAGEEGVRKHDLHAVTLALNDIEMCNRILDTPNGRKGPC
jgi:hypothetical protein